MDEASGIFEHVQDSQRAMNTGGSPYPLSQTRENRSDGLDKQQQQQEHRDKLLREIHRCDAMAVEMKNAMHDSSRSSLCESKAALKNSLAAKREGLLKNQTALDLQKVKRSERIRQQQLD